MPNEFDIVIGVLNREKIDQLTKSIDTNEESIRKLNEQLHQGTINQAQFDQAAGALARRIDTYKSQIKDLTDENIRLGQAIDTHANPSMRTAIHVMDQLAAGSEGLMRSIPSLAGQFGVGSDLVMGLGALTLAIDMTIKHWGELREQVYAGLGLDRTKSDLETIAEIMSRAPAGSAVGQAGQELTARIEEGAERAASDEIRERTTKAAKAGKALIEGTQTEDEKRRGELFKKTLNEYKGERLFGEIYQRETEGRTLTPTQRELERNRIRADIERAAKGKVDEEFYEREFGPEFEAKRKEITTKAGEEVTDKAMIEADAKLTHALEKQGRENFQEGERQRRADEKADKDRIRMLEEAGRKNEEFGRLQLEDEKKQLQRQKRDMIEAAHEMRTPHVFESTTAMLKSMQTAILGDVAKDQLREAKLLNQKIDKVNDLLDTLRIARVAP